MTDAEIMELAEEMRQELRHSHHTKEVHCSNCKHCIVDKDDPDRRAMCEVGWATTRGWNHLTVSQLMDRKRPLEFQDAYDCKQFDSMSDEADNDKSSPLS